MRPYDNLAIKNLKAKQEWGGCTSDLMATHSPKLMSIEEDTHLL